MSPLHTPSASTTTTPRAPRASPAERDYLIRQGNSIIAHGGTGQDVQNFSRIHLGLPIEERHSRMADAITTTGGDPSIEPNLLFGLSLKAYQGLTFGFGDEFSGTLMGILPGGRTPQEGRDLYREVLQAGSGSRVMDFIAELGGGAASGATLFRAAGLSRTATSAALAGAGESAIYAAGSREGGVTDRAKSALLGGILGGILGGVGSKAVDIAAPLLRQPARNILDRLGRIGASIQHRLPGIGTSEDHAYRILNEVLDAETSLTPDQQRLGVTTFDILRERTLALRDQGVTPTLADAGGETTLALMGEILRDRTPVKQQLVEALFDRQAAQGDRLQERLFSSIFRGDKFGLDNAYHAVEDLATARSQVGSPLYTQAHREMVPVSARMRQLIQGNPRLRAAYEEGFRLGHQEDLSRIGQEALAAGRLQIPKLPSNGLLEAATEELLAFKVPEGRIAEMLSQLPDAFPEQLPIRALDYMQQGLVKVKDRLIAQGGGKAMKDFISLNDQLEEILEEAIAASPTYGRARQAWAGMSAARDAVELGRGLAKKAPEVIEAELRALERRGSGLGDFYRLGSMQDIVERVRDAGATEDVASRVFGGDIIRGVPSNSTTQRLRALFGDDAAANDFFRRVAAEARLSRTTQVAGSTRPRSGSMFQESEQIAEGTLPFARAGGVLINAYTVARQRMIEGSKQFRTRVADDLSAVFARGLDSPQSLDNLIDSLEYFSMRQAAQERLRVTGNLALSSMLGVSTGKFFGS